jgi:hypothetical protein
MMSLAPDSFFKVPALTASLRAETNQVAGTQISWRLELQTRISLSPFELWPLLPMKNKKVFHFCFYFKGTKKNLEFPVDK